MLKRTKPFSIYQPIKNNKYKLKIINQLKKKFLYNKEQETLIYFKLQNFNISSYIKKNIITKTLPKLALTKF